MAATDRSSRVRALRRACVRFRSNNMSAYAMGGPKVQTSNHASALTTNNPIFRRQLPEDHPVPEVIDQK